MDLTDTSPADTGLTHADPLCTLLAAADAINRQLLAHCSSSAAPGDMRTHAEALVDHTSRIIAGAERAGLVVVARSLDDQRNIISIDPTAGD